MTNFAEWRKRQGLAYKTVADNGAPPPKNKNVPDKYKIPAISFFRFDQDRGVATKMDGK